MRAFLFGKREFKDENVGFVLLDIYTYRYIAFNTTDVLFWYVPVSSDTGQLSKDPKILLKRLERKARLAIYTQTACNLPIMSKNKATFRSD